MSGKDTSGGPVMRLFEVRTKPGCADALLASFATTSADVVRGHPGNLGYFFGRGVPEQDTVIFASLWRDLDAVKARFGADWQVSYLPDGYEQMIESCSVRHIDMAGDWHAAVPGDFSR